MTGILVAVNLSTAVGTKKQPVAEARLLPEHGLEGDAHAGSWHRQVSLLADESIDTMRQRAAITLNPGDFAENLTIRGLELRTLPVGSRLQVGDEALLEVTQIGKECHHGCAIRQQVGDCVMPREGIFARVLRGGTVRPGQSVTLLPAVSGDDHPGGAR